LYEIIPAAVSLLENGEGPRVSKAGTPLGPIGKTPLIGPKKCKPFLPPSWLKDRLCELFEISERICGTVDRES